MFPLPHLRIILRQIIHPSSHPSHPSYTVGDKSWGSFNMTRWDRSGAMIYLGFFIPNPKSELLALDQNVLPNHPRSKESGEFYVSKWYLLMLTRVKDELYAVLWSIELNPRCFKQMPSSSAYQENCYEQWVSNLVKFWTGTIATAHCKIITPASPSQRWGKKSTNCLSSVKTYGPNSFQLKTKAWNNYQM